MSEPTKPRKPLTLSELEAIDASAPPPSSPMVGAPPSAARPGQVMVAPTMREAMPALRPAVGEHPSSSVGGVGSPLPSRTAPIQRPSTQQLSAVLEEAEARAGEAEARRRSALRAGLLIAIAVVVAAVLAAVVLLAGS